MNSERGHFRSETDRRSWRHWACWILIGLGFLWLLAVVIERGWIYPEVRYQVPFIPMLAGLAGLYGLDTQRLQRHIAELERRLEADVPPEDATQENV
jgi:uncharacterized ion transporter superfamily protein YfcC